MLQIQFGIDWQHAIPQSYGMASKGIKKYTAALFALKMEGICWE